jgi:hypothetical protein
LSGRPRELYADAAYDTEDIRRCLESMGVEPNIPVNPRNGRRPKPYPTSTGNKPTTQSKQAENIPPPDNHTNNTVKRRHTTTQPRLRYEVLR